MRVHRFAAIAALVVFAASCDQSSDYCQALKGTPSIFCPGGPSYLAGNVFCADPSNVLWECNVIGPNGAGTMGVSTDHDHFFGASCGSLFCAASRSDAENQTGLAGDPDLSCTSNALPTWGTCLTRPSCNPCDDGQGGTLQNIGEYCNTGEGMVPVPGGSQCCAGLTCSSTDTLAGICQGTLQPCPQTQPNWQPLSTAMLRQIAIQNKVDGCDTQSGITQSRTIGLAFEKWVLTTIGVVPTPPGPGKNSMLFMSPARQNANMAKGGLPASVIPEFVGNQMQFPQSVLYEVKAVTGALTPGTSQYQILGLLDVANRVQPVPAGQHPAVFFITTGNTTVSAGVLTQATLPAQAGMPAWSVAVWQQQVLYDANGGSNPNLTLGPPNCLTTTLCAPPSAVPSIPNPGPPVSPLTSPTTPSSTLLVPGDPDPPEVD